MDIENLYLPIAHAEGKFVARHESILDALQDNQQLAIKYCNPNGQNGQVVFPHNPMVHNGMWPVCAMRPDEFWV